jgi:hypothetical protein
MYLIRSEKPEFLEIFLRSSFDALDDFLHCDLGRLNSLELILLISSANDWMAAQPVILDEDGGLAIFAFVNEGVLWLRNNADTLTDFDINPDEIRNFAVLTFNSNVYAIDTF